MNQGMKYICHSPKSLQQPFINLSTPLESPRRAAGIWSMTNFCFPPASRYNFAVFAGHTRKNTLFGGVTVATPHCGYMVSDEFLFFTYFLVQFCFFGMTYLKNTLFLHPHDARVHVLQT